MWIPIQEKKSKTLAIDALAVGIQNKKKKKRKGVRNTYTSGRRG